MKRDETWLKRPSSFWLTLLNSTRVRFFMHQFTVPGSLMSKSIARVLSRSEFIALIAAIMSLNALAVDVMLPARQSNIANQEQDNRPEHDQFGNDQNPIRTHQF